jgi:cytochrome c oxidase subunit 2
MSGNRVLLALLAAAVPAAAVLLALLLPGVAPPRTVTDGGRTIHEVYWIVYGLAAFVFVLVEATLLAFIVRYRKRRHTPDDVEGPQVHGNTRVEVAWTLIPAALLLALAMYTFARVPTVEAKPDAGEETVQIQVTAHQFYWQYDYGDGRISYDELVVPVDRKVTLVLESADVDHSWWVPDLTGKRDAIPGRTNRLNFTPRETGVFDHGVCGEFCGTQHARMTTRVEIVTQDEWNAWVAGLGRAAPETVGEQQWAAACAKCHGLEGEGDVGPPIARNTVLTNPDALRQLLHEGQDTSAEGYMPPVGKGWTDAQIEALIAFISSSDVLAPPGEGGSGGR